MHHIEIYKLSLLMTFMEALCIICPRKQVTRLNCVWYCRYCFLFFWERSYIWGGFPPPLERLINPLKQVIARSSLVAKFSVSCIQRFQKVDVFFGNKTTEFIKVCSVVPYFIIDNMSIITKSNCCGCCSLGIGTTIIAIIGLVYVSQDKKK